MKLHKLLFSIFFCCPFLFLHSQTKHAQVEMITDRPDQTESPRVVPKGFLQVETGMMFEKTDNPFLKDEIFTYNTTLLRYGLLENLELRLGFDLMQIKTFNTNGSNDFESGLGPLLAGFKIGISKEKGWLPEMGLLGSVFLSSPAAKSFETEDIGGEIRFSMSHTLSDRLNFSYNLGIGWDGNNTGAAYLYTITFGYGITDKLSFFGELYGDFPENSVANNLFDAGFTYLNSNNIQLDVSAGSSFDTDQNYFVSTGVSFRLPN